MIKVIVADITTLDVDAIVNAANSSLLGGGGVDGAIHRAAGPELINTTKKLGGCPTGEARITPGFNLRSKWIIHTVGPVWKGGHSNEDQLLENAYKNSLELALSNKIETIAFPSISTGVYHFPKEKAAEIAIAQFQLYENAFNTIIACCFSQGDADIYQRKLTSH